MQQKPSLIEGFLLSVVYIKFDKLMCYFTNTTPTSSFQKPGEINANNPI